MIVFFFLKLLIIFIDYDFRNIINLIIVDWVFVMIGCLFCKEKRLMKLFNN